MNDEKPWYLSRGIIGGVVAVIAAIAGAFGHTVAPADQAALIDALADIGGAAGGILAIYGRAKAKTVVK